jgi:glycosyltransferase involved in cell wall biosynthesis
MPTSNAPSEAVAQALPPGTTILQVLPALGHGGVERGTLEIAGAVVAAGGRALVASAGGPNVAKLEALGGKHFRLPLASKLPWVIAANQRRLSALIAEQGVSLVHARSRAPAWAASAATRSAGVPFVTTYHGTYNEGSWIKKRYNRIMATGDRVIAISDFIARLIGSRYDTSVEKIITIHRGADLEVFNPALISQKRLDRLRDHWDVPKGSRIVLLPARLTRWKGQELLLRAFAEIQHKTCSQDVTLVFAGGGVKEAPFLTELLELTAKLGIEPSRVRFPGHCDDMAAAMLLATIVVSASVEPEAFGRTVAEAGAMGTPVIAPNHGAAPEIILHEMTGWLVPPGDPKALAVTLGSAMQCPEDDLKTIGDRAKLHIAAHFSVATMQKQTLAVYRELICARNMVG